MEHVERGEAPETGEAGGGSRPGEGPESHGGDCHLLHLKRKRSLSPLGLPGRSHWWL